jgi:hypothetical protein
VADAVRAATGAIAAATAESVGATLSAAGMSVDSAALLTMAREVLERVAWDVVPPLAESLIREHIERLAKNQH